MHALRYFSATNAVISDALVGDAIAVIIFSVANARSQMCQCVDRNSVEWQEVGQSTNSRRAFNSGLLNKGLPVCLIKSRVRSKTT